MIDDVPSADELRTVSLRLFFKAWGEVARIFNEWEEFQNSPALLRPHRRAGNENTEDTEEWRDYISAAQNDLQGIYALIQQSQEIGLKAAICEVSPFLLLKSKGENSSKGVPKKLKFTDFPTIGAGELCIIHDTFCEKQLSESFKKNYNELRRNRNKIVHLGIHIDRLLPEKIIDVMLAQYKQLYPKRSWMADRLYFGGKHRWAEYYEGELNERTALLIELWLLLPRLSNNQFHSIMGYDRIVQRFICHWCTADADLDFRPKPSDVPTAYRIGNSFQVRCVICDKTYSMRAQKCLDRKCSCELVSDEPTSQDACMVCGSTADPPERPAPEYFWPE